MLFLQLFYTFFKIGLFGFGGGYAMLSMIQAEVVNRHKWVTTAEFTDIVAISQMTPGPIGINSATYVGYASVVGAGYSDTWGVLGSVLATFAVSLPSFILMLSISRLLLKHKSHPVITGIFKGLRPAVVGLIASAALLLMTPANFGTPSGSPFQFATSLCLFFAAFIAVKQFKVSPILVIVIAGAIGGIFL
ncbi:MAG: chromate transporter [Bacteroidaceae bacterium]|nr:chromate transporter [Bacteroidaceae bacterium]